MPISLTLENPWGHLWILLCVTPDDFSRHRGKCLGPRGLNIPKSSLSIVLLCSHLVHLILTAGSGGVWKFPIRFLATEAEVDDTITVEAVGLNKEAVVGFRLTSQSR